MADAENAAAGGDDLVAEYKRLLRAVLDSRPSGTRQRLAEVIGKNRSFISQITNPAYPTPIPAKHVERILDLCHFSGRERQQFMATYQRAHPRRFRSLAAGEGMRTVTLSVPDLGSEERNREFDQTIGDFVRRLGRLAAGATQEDRE